MPGLQNEPLNAAQRNRLMQEPGVVARRGTWLRRKPHSGNWDPTKAVADHTAVQAIVEYPYCSTENNLALLLRQLEANASGLDVDVCVCVSVCTS